MNGWQNNVYKVITKTNQCLQEVLASQRFLWTLTDRCVPERVENTLPATRIAERTANTLNMCP